MRGVLAIAFMLPSVRRQLVAKIAYEQGAVWRWHFLDTSEITVIHNDVLLGREAFMYAIVETGGKQYRVENGALLQVERLSGDVGGRVVLSDVRLVHGDKGVLVGQPLVKGATVTAEIVDQGRTRSIMVFKKQRRKNYRRTKGHRQNFTKLRITGIETA